MAQSEDGAAVYFFWVGGSLVLCSGQLDECAMVRRQIPSWLRQGSTSWTRLSATKAAATSAHFLIVVAEFGKGRRNEPKPLVSWCLENKKSRRQEWARLFSNSQRR